jgi:hypothetical protein
MTVQDNFGVEHEHVHIFAGSKHVVETTKTDVIPSAFYYL